MKSVNVQLDTAVLFSWHENFIRFVAVGGFIVNKQAGKSNYWKQFFHAVLACHNCRYLCGFLIPPRNALLTCGCADATCVLHRRLETWNVFRNPQVTSHEPFIKCNTMVFQLHNTYLLILDKCVSRFVKSQLTIFVPWTVFNSTTNFQNHDSIPRIV